MLKVLLKKQMTEIFRSYFYDQKKNRMRSKGAITAYIVVFVLLMTIVLGGMFTALSYVMCASMVAAGVDWLYFAVMGMLAILLGTFGSVFSTYSSLYLAKDNDLLLSMPIPPEAIIFSRLLGVYLIGVMYSGVVMVPAVIVYLITAPISFGAAVGGTVLFIMITVFVLTLSCLLGWAVAKLSVRLKNKSFIVVFISLLFMGAYYFFYFKAQTLLGDIADNAAVYGEKIKAAAYPVYLFGKAGAGDGIGMLAVSAVVLLLFGSVWMLLSKSFLKTAVSSSASASSSSRGKKGQSVSRAKHKSVSAALLGREFKRFTSSPNYMLNCGIGCLLMPAVAVLMVIRGGTLISVMNSLFGERSGGMHTLLCAAVCMIASTNDTAAPSVSLEGKSLWIAQSLPVRPWLLLRAKLAVQVLITAIPALVLVMSFAVICPYSVLELILTVAYVLLFTLLSALFGLFLGIKMPNLSWTNETVLIKQSANVLLSMLGSFVFSVAFAGLFFTGLGSFGYSAYILIISLPTVAACLALYLWLKKKGSGIFSTL